MIIASDLHLRTTTPENRVDDYITTQANKFIFILLKAIKSPPLVIAGDFFDKAKPGEGLLRWVIETLNDYNVKPIVIPGQHDLPYHNLDKINDSGLGVLDAAGVIFPILNDYVNIGTSHFFNFSEPATIWGVPFGYDPPVPGDVGDGPNILLWHHMVINDPLWPGQKDDKATAILRKYPQFNIIITGDNHQTFAITEHLNKTNSRIRWLINPGSMMRMTTAQIDHKPCIFKWDGGVSLEQIFLPITPSEEVFDLDSINKEKQKDERIEAFMSRLHTPNELPYELRFSFEKNIERYFRENQIDMEIQGMIWEAIGE